MVSILCVNIYRPDKDNEGCVVKYYITSLVFYYRLE